MNSDEVEAAKQRGREMRARLNRVGAGHRPRPRQGIGWRLMGYPANLPGWRRIYRLGARIHDRSAR